MLGFGRGGGSLTGLLIIIGVLVFTDAGGWLWNKVRQLGSDCYVGIGNLSPEIAQPVCNGVAVTIEAMADLGNTIDFKLDFWRQRIVGESNFAQLDDLLQTVSGNIGGMASGQDLLDKWMAAGPEGFSSLGASSVELKNPFRQSVDSYAIATGMVSKNGSFQQALPWFQHGALQPEGMGVLSQLALANVYIQGAPGIPKNAEYASYYLKLAQQSLTVLDGSSKPQALQMKGALPKPPADLNRQIARALHELQAGMKK
jgi:hypothetical protein